jgi:hypothetical protein
MNVQKFLEEVSKARNFKVDESCLENVLRVIIENQPLDIWDIFKFSNEYFDAIIGIVSKMIDYNLLTFDSKGRYRLTKSGRKFVDKLDIKTIPKGFKKSVYPPLPKKLKKLQSILKEIYKELEPKIKTEYEQGPLHPISSLRKVYFVVQKGDAIGKNIACIGDDDFLSIILGTTGFPKQITVFDIDSDILEVIEKYKKKLKIKVPIKIVKHNLLKPIPKRYKRKYDVFLTQPPDTVLGFTLFVSRGVELLKPKPGMAGYAGLTITGCPKLGLLEIQKVFTEMGLVITDILNKFLHYLPGETEIRRVEVPDHAPFPAKKIWYISDLIRVRTTKKTKPFYKGVIKEDIADYLKDAKRFQ